MRSHGFQSPYRCEACNARFWVLSRRARLGGVAAGVVALVLFIVVVVPILPSGHRWLQSPSSSVAPATPATGDDGARIVANRRDPTARLR